MLIFPFLKMMQMEQIKLSSQSKRPLMALAELTAK